MTVRVYRSTDVGAPTINGTAGSLINVLDGCLVTGYGSSPSSGWTKPYTSTNTAMFKQPATANGRYLYVDDTTSTYATVKAFETATSISATTGQFPHPTQTTGNLYMPKSFVADTSARAWVVIATNKLFYCWVNAGPSSSYLHIFVFGDFLSTVTNDVYNTILIANSSSSVTSSSNFGILASNAVTTGHYVARAYSQLGESIQVGKCGDHSKSSTTQLGFGNMAFPNPCDGKIYINPLYIVENVVGTSQWAYRGILPGAYGHLHSVTSSGPLYLGDVITNVAGASGKTFEVFTTYYSSGTNNFLLETSDTW